MFGWLGRKLFKEPAGAGVAHCPKCRKAIAWPPMSYGAEAPWRLLGVTEADFATRVLMNADLCVVDGKHFFIRGHIEIPVQGMAEPFVWSVWCSLSEPSFRRVSERWNTPGREHDEPMFGWLQTELRCYSGDWVAKAMVHTRAVGVTPRIEVDPEHAIGREQRLGIAMERVREFARVSLGEENEAVCRCRHC